MVLVYLKLKKLIASRYVTKKCSVWIIQGKKNFIFCRDKLADAIHILNYAAIALVDVRHHLISRDEAVKGYRLPASTFLYTSGEKTNVSLDKTVYQVERFGLFHGGKGTELTIEPLCDWLEYYVVLYKAREVPFIKGSL